MRSRFRELDGLRGLAALAVLVGHFTGTYNSLYQEDPHAFFDFPHGAFGVQLFFLISGFVILMSASSLPRASDFAISRLSRIYPAYWISILVAAGASAFVLVSEEKLSLSDTIINFTMAQRWLQIPSINGVYWTLAIEMQFYILVFILLSVTRCRITERHVILVVISWLVLAVGVAVWAGQYTRGVSLENVVTPVKIILNISLAEYGPLFATGMLVFLSRREGKAHRLLWVAGAAAVAVGALLHSWQHAAIIACICACFCIVGLRQRTGWLNLAPLQWVGKVSYSLYVVHVPVGYLVIRYTWPFAGRDAAMVLALVISLLVAWGTYIIGERHGTALLKRLLLRLRETRYQST